MERKALGAYGEKAALTYLRHEKGYAIRACNYRSCVGEIDIIAEDGETIVFVEVKTRCSDEYGLPCEAVEKHKRRKICRVAESYLARHDLWERPCRFDVVEVWPDRSCGELRVRHIVHAFLAERR
ncbi:YraN family protein [uncultured Megasphaera sp.]|uniref:YraN family protein n=1 Tax=Megasphaera sp. TaxID=2023260 RepID=UPI002601125B|nr:YraN family protein [uncultured Megasphaera sp.]